MKLYYWYIAITGMAWPSTQLICMYNQSLDDASIEKSALFAQLIAHITAGDCTGVSTSLTKHPEFILYRHDGNTVLTIAAHHKQLNIVFLLLKKNASINWLEYQALWAELSKEPCGHASKSILSFIALLRSSGYYYYHQTLKKIPDHLMLASCIQHYVTPQAPSWIQTFSVPRFRIPHIPYISGGLSFLVTYFTGRARKAEQLVYAAALDNNWSALYILLQQYASHLRPETYCRAASYCCYLNGNPYLALYILCHRLKRESDHPLVPFIGGLIDIFYKKSATDC